MRGQAPLRAQGTIEYLVIIAVVVVISLAVVSLFAGTASSPSTQISSSAGKLGSTSGGGIRVTEATIDPQGNAVVAFQNVSGEAMTITKISQEKDNTTITEVFFNEQIVSGVKSFYLTDFNKLCECTSGMNSRTCEFKVTYTTVNNLTKTEKVTINTQCVSNVTPKEPETIVGLGTGTLTNPWIINSCTELQNMNQHLDGNYALGTDINCYLTSTWNSGAGFRPIGTCGPDSDCFFGSYDYTFKGTFDGRDHTVSELTISRSGESHVGLFGTLTGTASNVTLADANITGSTYVGALTGTSFGTISLANSSGTLNGTNYTGGLVGWENGGTINRCYSVSTVTATTGAGGLVGQQYAGTVSNSYATGAVFSNVSAGGLIGISYGTVYSIYATGNVTADTSHAGGLIGSQSDAATLMNSFSTGSVTTSSIGGGVVGEKLGYIAGIYWYNFPEDDASSCYNGGDTSCTQKVVSWFYTSSNAPLSEWDFSTIWQANANAYPTLK